MTASSERRFRLCSCRILPQLAGSHECVQDGEQVSHRRGERHFLEFSIRQQSLIERLDPGVESRGNESGHVECAANTGTTSCGFSFTDRLAGIFVDRSNSDELWDLLSIELSEFQQFCDDRADRDWSDAFDGVQDFHCSGVGLMGNDRAHDIRRAFGTRWAKIVPASHLQQLMRHSNIETTMSFYVNITAKDTMNENRRHVRKNQVTQATTDSELNSESCVLGDTSGDTSGDTCHFQRKQGTQFSPNPLFLLAF